MKIDITLPAGSSREELARAVARRSGEIPFRVLRRSLDARKKPRLLWNYRIETGVAQELPDPKTLLEVERRGAGRRAVVVGSGPAGFFAADILNRAGFTVTLLEQGLPVAERRENIRAFEGGAALDPYGNYAFGEGGAGTFSDGKLTSRTKNISREREYVSARYVQYGAPEEIRWLAHPHIGSDRLFGLVQQGRRDLQNRGVDIRFSTRASDILLSGEKCVGVRIEDEEIPAEATILAPGHSAFPLFRNLIRRGVQFHAKNFALGFRIEHPVGLINEAQWGAKTISGLKAAEYRLSTRAKSGRSVYTFCMCPGGTVVPAAFAEGQNIVNGVSLYDRNGAFSNAAVMAALHPGELFTDADEAEAVLDALEALEARAGDLIGPRAVPATLPWALAGGSLPGRLPASSHPFSPCAADYRQIYPEWLLRDLADGLNAFSRKLRGFETGLILGVETTSSAVLQVKRSSTGECDGFPGLYLVGEGSGWAGGIMSSAVDGIKAAISLNGRS